MNRYAAIIDACVLGGGLKRNIILSLAQAGLFRPYWSARILDETERAILAIAIGMRILAVNAMLSSGHFPRRWCFRTQART